MYNVGRNNPRIRAALIEALELETAGKVQLGVSPVTALLASALLERAPLRLRRVLFTSSGTEAVEAALKLGRAATGRSRVVSCEHGFHGPSFPSEGYLHGAQELCRRYGTLFCVDEVQTGFGRTGRMFALDHWGLEPDLLAVAKSLSGGYVPVGALLMSTAVYDSVFDSLEHSVS